MGILSAIVSFFVQALALKWSLALLGQPASDNRYGTALAVAAALNVSWLLLGFFPLIGWFLYAVLWFAVIMGVYRVGFLKSLGVAVIQVGIGWGLKLLLLLVGLGG